MGPFVVHFVAPPARMDKPNNGSRDVLQHFLCFYYLHQGCYVFACVGLFVSCLFCEQNYTKTTGWISTKLGWMMGLGPEQTPSTFGLNLDKEMDQGLFLLFI